MHDDQIALQLYTVRALAATDLPGTLAAVAAAGYRAVEIAGLPETAPGELGRLLAAAGLRPIASHEGIDKLRAGADAVADRLLDLGCPRVIVPWLPVEDRVSTDAVRRFADEVSTFAEGFARRGMRLGYHNHDFEFAKLEGTTIWELLTTGFAPEVELELDVHWATVGGRDPVALIAEMSDRVRLLHMKDLIADPDPRDAPAGEGTIDFPSIVAAARSVGVEWYIAEQDHPRQAIDDIRSAYRYLASLAA